MTTREFRMPDPGEGLVEAEIVTWRVAVGDQVKVNDILVDIETSKSIVELPSPYAGTVTALMAAEGERVDVGAPIIGIADGTADPADSVPPQDDIVPAVPETGGDDEVTAGLIGGAPPGGRVAVLVGYGPRTTEAKRRPRRGAPEESASAHDQLAESLSTAAPVSRRADDREPLHADAPAPEPATAAAPPPDSGPTAPEPIVAGGPVLAKPPVRKLAKDRGIDLATLTGTGPGGVITREDVDRVDRAPAAVTPPPAAAQPAPTPASAPDAQPVVGPRPPAGPVADGPADVRIPIKGVRKATAAAMVSSAFTAPHVTEWVTCDVSETMELVARLKARREFAGVKISPLLVISKAVCIALSRTPELNSVWDEQAQEIVLKGAVNLGIAAATPRGLVVPNIKGAQALNLLDLAKALNAAVGTAREGRTQPAEMSGGSFTITNVGTFGVDAGTPILNPGEAGILCVGQIARRPWVVGADANERIEPRWVTTLAVSFDHRLADGAQGSTFLSTVAQILSDPGLALFF